MKQLCLVLVLAVSGCSFVLTRGPTDTGNPPRAFPDCTDSMTWPIVDGVFAALFVSAMFGALAEDDDTMTTSGDDDELTSAERATSAGLFAIATGVGAYVGYRRVSACRDAEARFHAAYPYGLPAANPYMYPQPYYPPQPYPAAPQPYPAAPQPQPQPPAPQPQAQPQALGTEGDVCASNAECATGLTCTSNVCLRSK